MSRKLKNLDKHLEQANQFIYFPPQELRVKPAHRLYAVRADFLESPECGVMASDLLVVDADDKPQHAEDLVLVSTPKGLVLTFYNLRDGNLELVMPRQLYSRFFRLNHVEVVGKIIFHIRRF